MKRFLLVVLWLVIHYSKLAAQVTVFSDNFSTSAGATYTTASGSIGTDLNWSFTRFGTDWGARIDGGILDLTNDVSATANVNGWGFGYTQTSFFISPYTPILSSNTGIVTWTFNMRQIRSDPSGFATANYGVAFILGGTSNLPNLNGNGYAVVLGQSGATDPVRLIKYNTGLQGTLTNIIISNTSGLADFGEEYLSVKVTYDPATHTWELFLRNDGVVAFADPAAGTLTSQGTNTDNTYIGTTLNFIGGFWNGSTGATQTAFFDNVKVTVGAVSNTITVGTVSALTFNIDCFTAGTATVDFTSSGTFITPNIYTAQLSNAAGSFASPTNIGTLSSIANSGSIPISIPAGTPTGAGYLIRIVSDNPAVTSGNTSLAITINLSGTCTSNATDFYRSKISGNWNAASTWESSVTGTAGTWINATLTPTNAANTIQIRNGHTVTTNVAVTVDQVSIESGGTLVNQMPAANALTIANGALDDIDIRTGGVYHVLSTQGYASYQTISSGATFRIRSGGTIRLGDGTFFGGSDNHLLASTSSSYIWENNSVFEWNSSGSFGSAGVTYFPDVDAVTIPVFRITSNIGSVGAGTATVINGVFEANGTISFGGSATKTFRNGIRGTGGVTGSTSGAFIIDGLTGVLGGAGPLNLPVNGLQIGSASNNTTVTLISNKTVSGDIQFVSTNNTYLELGAFNLTVFGDILGATINAYIKTNGTGTLIQPIVATSSMVFPIGNTSYNPLLITNLSASGANFNARVATGINDPSVAFPTYGINRTWYIGASAVVSNVSVQFEYALADMGSNISPSDLVEILKSDYTSWSILPGNTNLPQLGSYFVQTATALTIPNTPSPYAIGKTGGWVLPFDCIIAVNAQKSNNAGIINWSVNSCTDITSFEVQRSSANASYQTIGTIPVDQNDLLYNLTDPTLARGNNFYRIKVNGNNGSVKYSHIVNLVHETNDLILSAVTPNPVHSSARITLSAGHAGTATVQLFDMSGKLVQQSICNYGDGNSSFDLHVAHLSAGTYTVLIATATDKLVTRFVKL